MSNITFKKMNENHLTWLHQWFQMPHVLKWYAREEKYTYDKIQEKYRPRINEASISSFIIYDHDHPVGYIQFYDVTHHLPEGIKDYHHPIFKDFNPDELAGIDLFIADKDYLHRGFSSQVLTAFIHMYLRGKVKAILVDPMKQNISAISFFERNGFRHILSQDQKHDLMIKVCLDEIKENGS